MEKTKQNSRYSTRSILILTALIIGAGLIIFFRFLFGDETLVYEGAGSDTRQQYIMWYNSFVNHFRNGTFSFWDFTNGFGGSMFNYYVFAPFLLIIYGLGVLLGPSHLAGMMVYLIFAEILLAGILCYIMLSQWSFSETAKVITAFLYAFNGYLVVWGQHYALGFVCVELPLFMFVLEKTLRERIWCFGVALVSGLIILSSYYHGYMAILGMAIYVTVRVLLYEGGPFLKKLRTYFAVGFAMGFGVLIGGVNLIPSAAILSVTSRLNQKGSLLDRFLANLAPYGREYYRTLAYRFFGSNLQGTGRYFVGDGNYYEAVSLCMGALTILMLFQFLPALVRSRKARREYAAVGAGVFLCLFTLLVKAGSLIFNGFAYSFSRHTFLVVPFLALMTCYTLSSILTERKISLAGLVLGAVTCAAVYGKAYLNYGKALYQANALIMLAGALAGALVLLVYVRKKEASRMLAALLCLTVFVPAVSDGWLSYNNRETVKKSDEVYFGTYDGSTMDALAWIAGQDDQFYRVEKDYGEASAFLDSMAQSYSSATTYNSQQNSYIQQMVRTLFPRLLTGYDQNHYDFRSMIHDQPAASVMGIKYILSHEDDLRVKGYERIHQTGDVYIYRNTGTDNIARFYTATIPGKRYKALRETVPDWNLLGDVMITVGKTKLQADDALLEGREAQEVDGAVLPGEGDGYELTQEGARGDGVGELTFLLDPEKIGAYRHAAANFTLEVDGNAQMDIFTGDERAVEYFVHGEEHYELLLPEGTTELTIRAREWDRAFRVRDLRVYGSLYETAAQEADVKVDRLTRDDLITGTVDAKTSGYLMLAMPFQEGWTARLDGEEVRQIRADYGFTAIRIPEGSHSFRMEYRAPLLTQGAAVSAVSVLIWAALLIFFCVRRKKGRHAA